MEVLINAKTISSALAKLEPRRIAVAYVGQGWERYVSCDCLEEVIVSPTLGSNPKAIESMMQKLGAKNVHFLDELHSKLYVADDAVLLGSCNLSQNGVDNKSRHEVAVVLRAADEIRQVNRAYARYRREAQGSYPTTAKKEKKLKELTEKWTKAQHEGFTEEEVKPPKIADYHSRLDRIHIAWYGGEDNEDPYSGDDIEAVIPEARGVDLKKFVKDYNRFCEDDKIEVGDWMLCWHCNDNGMPRKGGTVYWLPVHYVVPHGVKVGKGDSYTKLALQVASKLRGTEPFELDKKTKERILKALKRDEFAALRDEPGETRSWRLSEADKVVPQFLEYVRNMR